MSLILVQIALIAPIHVQIALIVAGLTIFAGVYCYPLVQKQWKYTIIVIGATVLAAFVLAAVRAIGHWSKAMPKIVRATIEFLTVVAILIGLPLVAGLVASTIAFLPSDRDVGGAFAAGMAGFAGAAFGLIVASVIVVRRIRTYKRRSIEQS